MKNLLHLLLVFSVSVNAFIPSFGIKKHQQTRLSVVGKENFDMDELRHRIRKESNPYQNLFKTKEWEKRPKPEKVNIIFFQPDTAEEGMHTVEFPKGSASNIILAFESMKDCANFAANLKAQAFFDPTVSHDFTLQVTVITVLLSCTLVLTHFRRFSHKRLISIVSSPTASSSGFLSRLCPEEWIFALQGRTSKSLDTTRNLRTRRTS
jgi:hypothetical protein